MTQHSPYPLQTSTPPSGTQTVTRSLGKTTLKQLAERVESFDTDATARLNRLDLAIDKGIDANAWAACDIYKIIDPEGIVERFKRLPITDSIVQMIEWIRNTFIFAPIVITWYSISQATQAYNSLLAPEIAIIQNAQDPNSPAAIAAQQLVSQPFLYLWQQRFGGRLPDWLTLSSIGTIDALLLATILGFTILAYFLTNTRNGRRDHQAQQLRADLDNALANASLSLYGRPKPALTAGDNLEQVAQHFEAASRNMSSQLTTMIQQLSSQFSSMTQQVASRFDTMAQQVTTRFDTTAQQVTARFDGMAQQSRSQLDGIAQQMRKQFDGISQQMQEQLQEGGKYLTTLGTLTAGTVQLTKEMQTTATTLSSTTTVLSEHVKSLIGPVETMTKQQGRLLDAVQQAVGLLNHSSQGIASIINSQQQWSSELKKVLDSLNLAVEDAVKLAQNVGDFVQQQGVLFQHIQNAYDTQNRLATVMSEATSGVKEGLDGMQNGAVSMRSMARDMYDMMRMLAAIPSLPNGGAVVSGLSSANEYASAAAAIEQSASTLRASAVAIHKASQQLTDVIQDWHEDHLQQKQP